MTLIEQSVVLVKADAIHDAAQTVARAINDKQPISRAMINEAMQAAFGATNASGVWSQRDSFEMLEHATVLALVIEQAINDDC